MILILAGNPFMREHTPTQLKHPAWHGLTFADIFFPLFLFVIGVAMTLSRRVSKPRLVLRRVALLFAIGVALASLSQRQLAPFGVLQHIAGAYLLAWLVLRAPRRMQPLLAAATLGGMWIAFLLYAGPGEDPWSRHDTLSHAIDRFFIGRFSTEGTVPTIMSAVTILGGAFIGRGLKERRDPARLWRWVAGHALWLVALALLVAPYVPINKRLWSVSFTLLTIGTSCAWFALFIWWIDQRGHRQWSIPLEELGANPIAIYVGFIMVRAAIGGFDVPDITPFGSPTAGAFAYMLMWLVPIWLAARALYRRGIFIKI